MAKKKNQSKGSGSLEAYEQGMSQETAPKAPVPEPKVEKVVKPAREIESSPGGLQVAYDAVKVSINGESDLSVFAKRQTLATISAAFSQAARACGQGRITP